MYIRHAKDVAIRNLRLDLEKPDQRPALMADDVDGLEVCGLRAGAGGSEPLIRLRNTRRAWIQNAQPAGDIEAFLPSTGPKAPASR